MNTQRFFIDLSSYNLLSTIVHHAHNNSEDIDPQTCSQQIAEFIENTGHSRYVFRIVVFQLVQERS